MDAQKPTQDAKKGPLSASAGGFGLVALVFSVLAGFAWVAKGRSAARTTTKGAPLPSTRKGTRMEPKAGNERTAGRIRDLAERIRRVWTDASGQAGDIPQAALELALAHAAVEHTGYGQGWDGEMVGSNNVGSYQCGGAQQSTTYYRCVPHGDSSPQADGSQKKYTTTFRYYIDGTTPDGVSRSAADAAAWDFIHSITVKPFAAANELASGDVLAYAKRLAELGYFEGFNLTPAGAQAYADSIAALVSAGLKPRRANVTPEQFAGRIALYASGMARALPEIAAALGSSEVAAVAPEDLRRFEPRFVRG